MAKPSTGIVSRMWRSIKRVLLILFVSSLFYIIITKWVMPPVTITQLSNAVGYGL